MKNITHHLNLKLEYFNEYSRKYFLVFRVMPYIFLILTAKYLALRFHFEPIEYSPLIGNLVAANLFLLGFVVGETLREFRVSEKLPGAIVTSLENMIDLVLEVKEYDQIKFKHLLEELIQFSLNIRLWLYRKVSTSQIHQFLHDLGASFVSEDKDERLRRRTLDNFFKERNEIRKSIVSIDVMRKTEFVSSGYTIAKLYTTLLIILLIFTKLPSASYFTFVILIAFTALYLIFLVEDLDNPFTYSQEDRSSSKVSLRQLKNFELRTQELLQKI